MDLSQECPDKLLTPAKSVKKIKNGSRVFIGTGCGEPQCLIKAMVEDRTIQDIVIYQMLSSTLAQYINDSNFLSRFSIKLFFISVLMRQSAFEGKIDYIPVYLSQIPRIFETQEIGLDVAMIQISPPDEHGYCSLGISVDITLSGMKNAEIVIAQVNPQMPRTWGDSVVHIDELDYIVEYEEPLLESRSVLKNQTIVERIAHYVNMLVDDGSTLQIGFGHLPDAVVPYLSEKKDLGLHTQVITDGLLPLFKQKVITNRKKNYIQDRVVASLCMGSKALYDYVDNNPMFYFKSSEFVNDPNVIAKNDNFISISSALEVDLTGQACTDSKGYLFYSGIGDQVDFIRGSALSKGGFSIIIIPSTAQDGKVSRIVPHLSEGAGVATTRGDIDIIVTEYGIAEMRRKSIYQRVIELAQIAHPKFRKGLIEEAKKRHYIFPDQLPPTTQDLIFLDSYTYSLKLPNGKNVEFRPLFPSDEFESRHFYYSLQETSIYYRFFNKRKVFSREMLQRQWAEVDYQRNMTLIGLMQLGKRKQIVAIGSYAEIGEYEAEVAFLVKEDLHGMGIATFLLQSLESIARENNYKKFIATTLAENKKMLNVFQRQYPDAKLIRSGGGEVDVEMDFA
ncbi:bifunctional acetyl-CoA hydrolase/transferase family protein/GNAT family N-acetyltransferase [Desulfospira joergensenii]|uniref:bifunctional acetyl-CoA hydrolase/transferase family protein/GNAT family N-acetyltransferase n=1 Tax=Desulfospira joergensenii TaxID=53329 RepID=UPI0003B798F6|nr:bifunctional acetyl-CoA hydrolase/transferase family protein/GNAT family N-acetyltransferase [Desulfospira joergensenii]